MAQCSTSRAIRWMPIKTTMRYHLTICQNGYHYNSINNKCWRRFGEKGTLVHCWWECRLVQPLWKTVWNFLKKLKMELPFDPAIPLLGIYPKKPNISNSKECMNYIHSSTIYNSQDLETA